MESKTKRLSQAALATRTYYLLTKPGILLGNALTTSAGFLLASKGTIGFFLFLATLMGLSCIIASACVFNNYIDRVADEKMERTKYRPLVVKSISATHALIFAVIIGCLGTWILWSYTNLLTVSIALLGFFVYVVLYTFLKYHSTYGTLVGSIAGAIPPVAGYCAVKNQLDLPSLLFFGMMVCWQMPHFYAIAIYRLKDYAAASIPVFPVKKNLHVTKVHMLLYIIAFIVFSLIPVSLKYLGYFYLLIAGVLGLTWLSMSIKGFKCENDRLWARQMFGFSLIVILGICLSIPLSVIP